MLQQKIENKIAEIKYREKISKQHLGEKNSFANEKTFPQMLIELKKRILKTKADFKKLKKNVDFSNYLEIGAENCQRAMVLEKDFNSHGFASDLSLSSLQAANSFAKHLKYKKVPQRLVCDTYNLPFPDNSLPFVFCYQTLHHFPNPQPIINEIYRVLTPGGYLFFDEEPISQVLNLGLWRRPTCLRPWEKVLKIMGILPFISKIGKSEVDNGILEESFDLNTWQKSLEIFDRFQTWLSPYPFGPKIKITKNGTRLKKPPLINKIPLYILGGNIQALAQKKPSKEKSKKGKIIKLSNLLVCPVCIKKNPQTTFLKLSEKKLMCPSCKTTYPILDKILMLLPEHELKLLYPNIYKNRQYKKNGDNI